MLFLTRFSFPQILRKIRQSHHNNCQADHISYLDAAVKHPRDDNSQKTPNDRSDNKYLKLIQYFISDLVSLMLRFVV